MEAVGALARLLGVCLVAAACTGGGAPSPSAAAATTTPTASVSSGPTQSSRSGAAACTGEDFPDWDEVPQVGQAYAITWLGPDGSGRLSLLEESLAVDGSFVSATMDEPVIGREALAAAINEFHGGSNNFFEMRAWNDGDYHHDRIRLRWRLCGPEGESLLEGEDILELDEQSLIREATRFHDEK